MDIRLPNINDLLEAMIEVPLSFDGEQKQIKEWVQKHRETIQNNQHLITQRSEENDITILLSMLRDLMVRAMRGEKGIIVYKQLLKHIRRKKDLRIDNYNTVLKNAQYRWGVETGVQVITNVVDYFSKRLNWNWSIYFNAAEQYHDTNFQQDELLKINNISFKVRDLALSCFNGYYVANDLHVVRVMTRIGLLNYGFDLLYDTNLEMGNNPSNPKNYLFLHHLVHKLSNLTGGEYLPADLDRIFWSFGKSICGSRPNCSSCSINKL